MDGVVRTHQPLKFPSPEGGGVIPSVKITTILNPIC